jgi:uncharacterized protein (TIGR03435 family)
MSDTLTLLLSASIRMTAVLTIAWLITALLRRSAASARHLVWTCAIGVVVVTPILLQNAPWHVSIPDALMRWSPPLDTTFVDERSWPDKRSSTEPDATSSVIAADETTVAERQPSVRYIGTVWTAGVFVVLLYMLICALAAARLRRAATAAGASWINEGRALAKSVGVPRVAFAESALVRVPLVCGVVKPLVIVPSAVSGWDAERRQVVLLHELAHVRRRDCLTQLIAQIACAMYWFHPLAWLAAHRLRVERERACDDFVLAAGVRGSAYARHLVAVAKNTFPHPSLLASSSVAMTHRSQLEGRLTSILDPSTPRTAPRLARLTAVMFAVCALGMASLRLEARIPASISSVSPSMGDIALGKPAALAAPPSSATSYARRPLATVQSTASAAAGRRFAVASIRVHVPNGDSFGYINTEPGGRFLVMNMPLRQVIEVAFGIRSFQLLDAPDWIQSAKYDITALTGRDEDLSVLAMQPIIQTLLADRFQLDIARESRITQTYSLVRIGSDALGPGLRRGPEGRVDIRTTPNKRLAYELSGLLNTIVEDRTGLTEAVNPTVGFNQLIAPDAVPIPAARQNQLEQLGLRLEPRQAPVDVIVVKRIERPVEQ